MELTHQVLQLAGTTLAERGYTGGWQVGIHITRLEGLRSTHAMNSFSTAPQVPFQTATYTRHCSASTDDLTGKTPGVVEALLGDLARGFGLNGLFPYTNGEEISERQPRR